MNYKVKSYRECLDDAKQTAFDRHLLLGNGFSISYNPKCFSYTSLKNKLSQEAQEFLNRIGSDDFEFAILELEKQDQSYKTQQEARQNNKKNGEFDLSYPYQEGLNFRWEFLNAVLKHAHPRSSSELRERLRENCATFLESFHHIFTTNYDLLLYWVTVAYPDKFADGCFKSRKHKQINNEELLVWKERSKSSKKTNIWYLHGALHLYDLKRRMIYNKDYIKKFSTISDCIVKYKYEEAQPLITQISENFTQNSFEPLIVMEGSSEKKLTRILGNEYLWYANHKFGLHQVTSFNSMETNRERCLFIFGQDLKENDSHILRSIHVNTKKVYYGIFNPSDIENKYEILKKHVAEDCEIVFFETSQMNIWGK